MAAHEAAAFNPCPFEKWWGITDHRTELYMLSVHRCQFYIYHRLFITATIKLAFSSASQFGTIFYHYEIPGVVYNHNASGFIVLHPFDAEKT